MYACLYVRADLLHADSSDAELARHGRISLRDLVHVVRGVFRGHEVHDDLLLGLSSLLKIIINVSEYAAYIHTVHVVLLRQSCLYVILQEGVAAGVTHVE